MSTTPEPNKTPPQPLLQLLVSKQKQAAQVLLIVALALAVLTVGGSSWWAPSFFLPIFIGGTLATFAFLIAGLERLLNKPAEGTELDIARVVVLTVGGLLGLGLFLAGVVLGWMWWDNILSWLDTDGPAKEFRWRAGVVLLVVIGGLGAMFASLQLGRSDERANVVLRRLLYGYNAVLTGLLLLASLLIVNVLAAARFKVPTDFTAVGNFTLSTQSQNILKNLSRPVEITNVPGYQFGLLEDEVRTLLTNCRSYSDKIQVKELALHIDPQRAKELQKEYPGLEPGCILIVCDTGETKDHRILKESELFTFPEQFNPSAAGKAHQFTGEDALLTALTFLAEGQKKPVLYFTQGNGELDLNESTSRSEKGCGALKTRLEKRNFDVKPLKFELIDAKVPDDASMVVIAGPKLSLVDNVKALKSYMGRGGKLLVMLDPQIKGEKMEPTGLEGFLPGFGVQLPPERILTLPTMQFRVNATGLWAAVDEKMENHPLGKVFSDERFPFENVRPLQVSSAPPGAGAPFMAQTFLRTITPSWGETNFAVKPSERVRDVLANQEEIAKTVNIIRKNGPLTVAALVSESGLDPRNPHAAMMGGDKKQTPRMVVFGTSSPASNLGVEVYPPNFDLLANCIDWLRDRPNSLGIPPKRHDTFVLQPKSSTELFRMIWLPPLIIVSGVLGLATGVWVVRRR